MAAQVRFENFNAPRTMRGYWLRWLLLWGRFLTSGALPPLLTTQPVSIGRFAVG
jgi:hypothetical protein